MSSSTIATATATTATPAHTCTLATWCESHEDVPDCPGFVVHLSSFDVGSEGSVTAIKAYTWNGEPTGGATVLLFTPLPGKTVPLEQWRVDWLRSLSAY